MNKPEISFLMAAFERPGLAVVALESLQRQTMTDWELVVSPDDGRDYRELAQADARVRIVRTGAVGTGPAHARNRALAVASGALIAVLDDDDCLESGYAAQAARYFQSHEADFAITPTRYFRDSPSCVLRQIGQFPTMDIARFGLEFGTMHAIGRREVFPRWKPGFAEDVMHTAKCIDLAGGEIAVLPDASYLLRLHPDSLCAQADGQAISRAYGDLAANLPYRMTETGAARTRQLLLRRIRMNDAFTASGGSRGYHQFVQEVQRGSTPGVRFSAWQ
ncbi:MAG: hypothetical protein OJF60_002153 [Burkholderiaceae bacterium]|jgi:glycosyltransferase involved in cell wall biosynthesis|nr:MAG: hypothetical protein OJF60_002153 [Burkholderiaceae bacterium]